MTKPQWEQIREYDGGVFAAELAGKQLTVYRDSRGAWRLLWSVMGDRSETLAATNARDAQLEAIEFVRGWATELVAQAAELRGTMEADDA